jgi:hypothetical protein
MRYCILSLLLVFVVNITNSQTLNDSLQNELIKASGTHKIDILNQLMKSYLCRNNQEALNYFNSIQLELTTVDYVKGHVEMMKNFGTLKYCTGYVDSALYYY